ncbi:MAG: serine/threonine-protein phosphatase [Planctomycetes bacterium]|nr:serine/threonine-protein phosphatase [Planctomycetota bacterium]
MSNDARRIACMEVWGGHEGFEGSVSVPGHDVFVGCAPHTGDSHGGDIYYVSSCAAGAIARFVLADVAGHGHVVAEQAATLRNLMRRYINTADQSKFARALNRKFAGEGGRFATAILLTYFAPTDQIVLCNAGHPRPLFRSRDRGRWEFLDASTERRVGRAAAGKLGANNLPLGIVNGTPYEQFCVQLQQGDLLAVYSDAFLEAPGADGKPWGEAGLLSVLNAIDTTDPSTIRSHVVREVANRTGRPILDDDATMIVLHHNASDPPRLKVSDRLRIIAKVMGVGE